MGRDKTRTVLYTVAGIYLGYLAYGLSQDLGTVTGGEKLLVGAFMVVFAVAGVGLVVWGIRKGMAQAQEAGEERTEAEAREERAEAEAGGERTEAEVREERAEAEAGEEEAREAGEAASLHEEKEG